MKRRGAAKGTGSGYKNLRGFPKDPMVHSQAAKGIKQPQLRTTLGGWHEIGHVNGTGALKKGEFVKSKFTGEPGTVVGTSPFAVKYGQHVRYSNPKFWARGKTSATPQSACPTFHKLSKADKMKVMSKVSQSGLRGMKALEYAEVLSITMQQARGEQRGGKAAPERRRLHWIAASLVNDEESTDDDLRLYFIMEGRMSDAEARHYVAQRNKALLEKEQFILDEYRGKGKEKVVGGLGDNRPDSDFDPVELRKGMHVEEEHTRDTAIAKEIAKDHLTEDKNYYKKLAKMEGRGGKRGGKYAEKYQKDFELPRGFKIEAHYEKTRNGFRHVARLYKDGVLQDEVSVPYLNRTWESFKYETAIKKLLDKTGALKPEEKAEFLGGSQRKAHEEAESIGRSVAMVASMGDIFGTTPKEKNDWKLRMIKAGMPGVEQPEDWGTLSEDEKAKRLNKVIAQMKR